MNRVVERARRVRARAATGSDTGLTLVEVLVAMVVVTIVLSIVTQVMAESDKVYRTQQQTLDARNNTAAALDMIGRMIRQSVVITPDPDGNGLMDSIRLQADWNPYDGDQLDPYETVQFSVAGGTLFKQEPSDPGPVPFAERINSITFTYFDVAGVQVASPAAASPFRLARVNIVITTTPLANGWQGRTYASSVTVRRLE